MPLMRAKMKVLTVTADEYGEQLKMCPVAKKGSYPEDGSDEDNTYAKFSPSGALELRVQNPALLGQIKPGQHYYVDFTLAE